MDLDKGEHVDAGDLDKDEHEDAGDFDKGEHGPQGSSFESPSAIAMVEPDELVALGTLMIKQLVKGL